MIRVRAIRRGYYGKLREVGDEFTIPQRAQHLARWMEVLEEPAPAAEPPPRRRAKRQVERGDDHADLL